MSSATKAPGAEGAGGDAPCWDPNRYDRGECSFPACACKPPQTHIPYDEMSPEGQDALRAIVRAAQTTTAPTPTDRVGKAAEYVGMDACAGEPQDDPDAGLTHWQIAEEIGALAREGRGITATTYAAIERAWQRGFQAGRPSAPAPSDPAGAGGDLGGTPVAWKYEYCIPNGEGIWEQRVSFDKPRDGHWLRRLEPLFDRSGQIVASTPGQKGAGEAIKFAVGIDDHYDRLEFLQSWLSGDTSEWPEFIQTPPSPPSATPEGDPPMTVKEAREVLAELDPTMGSPEMQASELRAFATDQRLVRYHAVYLHRADRIELALRTLHAAGEVR